MSSHTCNHHPTPDPEVAAVLGAYPAQPDSLIPILHAVQKRLGGYLHEAALHQIAAFLAMPASRVYGVATFYSLLNTEPKGKYIIRVCSSAPCYAVGSANILTELRNQLGIVPGQTTPNRKFTLEYTSCLGVCGVAPAIMINNQVYGNLTPAKLQEIIEHYEADLGEV